MALQHVLGENSAECPCLGHCTTALGDDVCRSCLRTLDEVTHWPALTEDQRRAVNRRIARLSAAAEGTDRQ